MQRNLEGLTLGDIQQDSVGGQGRGQGGELALRRAYGRSEMGLEQWGVVPNCRRPIGEDRPGTGQGCLPSEL